MGSRERSQETRDLEQNGLGFEGCPTRKSPTPTSQVTFKLQLGPPRQVGDFMAQVLCQVLGMSTLGPAMAS